MSSASSVELKLGAVGLLDILGARERFKNFSPAKYMADLRAIEQRVRQNKLALEVFDHLPLTMDIAFFSDTILVCVAAKGAEVVAADELLNTLVAHVIAAIHAGVTLDPPLTYRGCISIGRVAVDGPFFAGPAVNEAAEWYEKAEAGVVWMTPTALAHSLPSKRRFFWNVPLKGGERFATQVVNPLVTIWEGSEPPFSSVEDDPPEKKKARAQLLRTQILQTFDDSKIPIAIKRAHTREMLDLALSHLTAAEEVHA